MARFLTRFAPSPTGYLHLGHVASALAVWRAAEEAGGPKPILRIEDIDTTRCKTEYEKQILEDLAWLGFEWQAGVRRQSEHLEDYATILKPLESQGLVYKCFRSRKDISTSQSDVFRGAALPKNEEETYLEQGKPFALRLSIDHALEQIDDDNFYYTELKDGKHQHVKVNPNEIEDVVLKRKDIAASYHLACTRDDAAAGITHIVRGEDLLDAAPVHTLLQRLMSWPAPVYTHHNLILDNDGNKLSKRDGSTSIARLRKEGMSASDILSMADPSS